MPLLIGKMYKYKHANGLKLDWTAVDTGKDLTSVIYARAIDERSEVFVYLGKQVRAATKGNYLTWLDNRGKIVTIAPGAMEKDFELMDISLR